MPMDWYTSRIYGYNLYSDRIRIHSTLLHIIVGSNVCISAISAWIPTITPNVPRNGPTRHSFAQMLVYRYITRAR